MVDTDAIIDKLLPLLERTEELVTEISSIQAELLEAMLIIAEKPSWEDAPEWARYLAQNGGGRWYWFERRPIIDYEEQDWAVESLRVQYIKRGPHNPNWQSTLEERPIQL